MKRALVLLAIAFLASGYLAAALVATATRDASPLEDALAARGHTMRRAAASALPALAQGDLDAVVLATRGPLPASEQRALLAFASSGGILVVVGDAPASAAHVAEGARMRPGLVYAADGGPARLDGSSDALPSARSLDIDGSVFAPLARTEARAFRDSDGDGQLDLGEPAGPFVVAAQRDVGAGRVVLVAVDDPGALASAPLLLDAVLGDDALRVALAEPPAAWAAPAAVVVHAAALPTSSLLPAAGALLAAGGALAWLLGERAGADARARSAAERLVHDYRSSSARASDAAQPPGDKTA